MSEKMTLEVTKTEAELLTMASSLLLKAIEEEIAKHRNHKDYSMDKLFAKMEMYVRTGDLWVRLQKMCGATQEEIAEYLMDQEA